MNLPVTKNQHYVPRFYMKPFSNIKNAGAKNEKVLISFYQFDNNILKDKVPTSSICSEDFFYDNDGSVENMLAQKESKWSETIKKVLDSSKVDENDYYYIKEFVLYQITRSKAMKNHNQDMAENILTDSLLNRTRNLSENCIRPLVKERVEKELTPDFNISMVNELISVLDDYEIDILINKTDLNFITSDVPVIITNPFDVHIAGLADIGTVIFFPISLDKMILLYDKKFYKKIDKIICQSDVVKSINKYQYISADERIMSKDLADFQDYINDRQLNFERKKLKNQTKVKTAKKMDGTFIAAMGIGITYAINIPLFALPKALRKIPVEYRETFPRQYSIETRREVLCRIYRNPDDFIVDHTLRERWKNGQQYYKKILKFLDYYWDTPKEDLNITPLLMHQLKTVPVNQLL
ncbi:DUF4238 domain-containing protein [Candidatus Weimeria sp. HCP3S3_B5]|uniref:DUF4238 domain-containing protein n=1 Tax=Candidatus Weimeria sp. HCP3S3_B5 TaxID=3438871 RepID=UPI003F8B3E95